MAKLREDNVSFNIEWIPSELDSNIPLEGISLENKFPKNEIKKIYEDLNNIGYPYNIKFENANMSFNTHRALLAGEYAKTVGKYDEFSKLIYQAIFIDIENIGDKSILNNIAQKINLDVEEMNKLIDEGKYDKNIVQGKKLAEKYNIKEVPSFLINDEKVITNVRKYNRLKESIIDAK